jgi:hypothetical protein
MLTAKDKKDAYTLLHQRGIMALDLALVQLYQRGRTTADREVIQVHIEGGNIERDSQGLRLTHEGRLRALSAQPYRHLLAALVGDKEDEEREHRCTEEEIDEMTGDEAKEELKRRMRMKREEEDEDEDQDEDEDEE